MCDRYNSTHGYICSQCFDRLVKLGVKTDLEQFFNTEPPAYNDEEASEAYFNILFKYGD